MKPDRVYRYQISGPEKHVYDYAESVRELCEQIFRTDGPELCLLDLKTNELISWDRLEEITGVGKEIWDNVFRLHIESNHVFGQIYSKVEISSRNLDKANMLDMPVERREYDPGLDYWDRRF